MTTSNSSDPKAIRLSRLENTLSGIGAGIQRMVGSTVWLFIVIAVDNLF
jgi:hypothetical protein